MVKGHWTSAKNEVFQLELQVGIFCWVKGQIQLTFLFLLCENVRNGGRHFWSFLVIAWGGGST